jgi:hypothetical protein
VTFWKNNFGQQLLFVSDKVFRFLVSVKCALCLFLFHYIRCYSSFSYHVALD